MDGISDIYQYILYLRDRCGLRVSLHSIRYDPVIHDTKLRRFRLHDNPYCLYVGTYPQLHQHCVEKQRAVCEKSRDGAYCGTCFAGVREYVYPIHAPQEVIGIICVSGYFDEHASSYHNAIVSRYRVNREELLQSYALLRPLPPQAEVDVLIHPLQRMLELCYLKSAADRPAEPELCENVVYYLQLHHTRRITIDELCDEFFCSRSSLSHKFKQYTGQSITQYIRMLRVESAKTLLAGSHLRIGTIAAPARLENSNYFSNAFTAAVGMSPSQYRKKHSRG